MTNVVIHYRHQFSYFSARVISKNWIHLHQNTKNGFRFIGNEISMWAVDIFWLHFSNWNREKWMTEKNVCFSWLASGYDSRNNHLVAAGGLFFPCFQERENKKNPPKTQTRTPNHSPQDSFARRTTSNKHDRNILTPQQKMYINKQKKRKEKKRKPLK